MEHYNLKGKCGNQEGVPGRSSLKREAATRTTVSWLTASKHSAFRICPRVQIKAMLSPSSSLERLSIARVPQHGNFLSFRNSSMSNLCTSAATELTETCSELYQSLRLSLPNFSSFSFHFHSCQICIVVCRLSLPTLVLSALYLAPVLPPLSLLHF